MIVDGLMAVTTAGTRLPLIAARTVANWIIIQSKTANTGKVYIGGSTVSSTSGIELQSADDSVEFPAVRGSLYDLSKIYIDVSVNLEGVKFIYDAPV